jgi:antitoxin (DNA-binding transcriptional repressor) of toxin-antitoxin stability system
VTVSVSDFRKNLFALLERAANGELVEFTHRDRSFRLVQQQTSSKLSRLTRNDFLVGSIEDVETAQAELSKRTRSAWERKWRAK